MKRSGASQEISDEDDEVKALGSKLKKLKLHKKGASGGGFGSQLLAEANPIVSAMLKQIKTMVLIKTNASIFLLKLDKELPLLLQSFRRTELVVYLLC